MSGKAMAVREEAKAVSAVKVGWHATESLTEGEPDL